MKTSRPIYIIRYILLLLLPVLSSCRKDLCYDHFPTASISISYEQAWERDYGMDYAANWDKSLYGFEYADLQPNIPEWVTLVNYSSNETTTEKHFPSQGGDMIVPYDGTTHSFLLYNSDTEYIVISDIGSLTEARASATLRSRSTISTIQERHPNTRSTNPPDVLYSAFIENVPDIGIHEVLPLSVKMQPLVFTYVIRYEFEYGLQYVALARGALGGMAESVNLRNGTTSDESTIILYDCERTSYGYEARVRSFGIPGFPDKYYGRSASDPKERPYTLNLEVMLENGKTKEFNFDISDQMAKQPRGGVIRVSGLRVEDQQNMSDSGFDVDVNDWDDHQEIDIPFDFSYDLPI
ncbi:MAG: DUF5119 domain-containing protein [Prevotella sp.]|nr:DUF5119 domain-containing protein [Prevotella sp.]